MSKATTIASRLRNSAIAAAIVAAATCLAGEPAGWTDADGDVVIRRTDGSGVGIATTSLPDLRSVSLRGWYPKPIAPYAGRSVGTGGSAPALRLDVVFNGLVNPPGEVGLFGTYSAFAYGPAPVFGFIELDVDRDADTGGELPGAAELRYLANVGRFGAVPAGPAAARAALAAADLDGDHETLPHYERSGADFSLVLCGCHEVQLVSTEGNDLTFGEGETWVVRSRFFQRAGGYSPVSAVLGGSNFGEYDPLVDLRFSHDAATNTTTLTLVYPLDELGASLLSGQPVQPVDPLIGFGSHASVVEALQDLVNAAGQPNFGHPLTTLMLMGWAGRNPRDYLDPTQWTVRAIVGTTYALPSDGLYIWTDVGFGELRGDVDGDGSADEADNAAIQQAIATNDGGVLDADGVTDGRVMLADFGYNFSAYDVNGDGAIDENDLNPTRLSACRADWDSNARVEIYDLLGYLQAWFAHDADMNDDGVNDTFDLLTYLDAFFTGC